MEALPSTARTCTDMTTQQDADLIRELNEWGHQGYTHPSMVNYDLLRRAAARIEELTQRGEVVVTRANGAIVAVTRQDEEGRILSIIAETEPPAPLALSKEDAQAWARATEWANLVPLTGSASLPSITILAVDTLLKQRIGGAK